MKTFTINSVINPLAQRAGLIDLRGHRVPLPGVASPEPLMRGCNQREWLERLVKLGLRHVVVPLNGPEEDTCLYARRHPGVTFDAAAEEAPAAGDPAPPPPPKRKAPKKSGPGVLYDLEHRDEGFFARLQFLLSAADEIGVMIGISLFDVSLPPLGGPFTDGANVQKLVLPGLVAQRHAEGWASFEKSLQLAAKWVAAEARGRRAVWVEIFRGQSTLAVDARLQELESRLIRSMSDSLTRTGEDARAARQGPWVVAAPGFDWKGSRPVHVAPFDVWRGAMPERDVALQDPFAQSARSSTLSIAVDESSPDNLRPTYHRRPSVYHFNTPDKKSAASLNGEMLWRTAMRGYWPIVPGGFEHRASLRRWNRVGLLATFAKQWVGKGYLRPCPELLDPLPTEAAAREDAVAATDGCGRYFVYFSENWFGIEPGKPRQKQRAKKAPGITVSVLPSSYRFFWFDALTGMGLDVGDSLAGGLNCQVPGIDAAGDAVLILEQEELPDPLSVW